MRRRAAAFSLLFALACNEVLGLDPGVAKHEEGAGGTLSGSRGGNGNGQGGGAAACSTTADCIEQGLAWPPNLCLAGACVDVLTEECDTLLGAEWLSNRPQDQPLVFGAVAENVDERSAEYWSLELAMRELAQHGPVPIDGAPQRPVLLVCRVASPDPFSLPTQRSLDHLIDDVGVPGMVMIQSRPELLASMQYAIGQKEAQTFFIDVGSGDGELLGRHVDSGRLWHMLGDSTNIASLYYPLVRLVEEHVNPGASTGNGARPTRAVMIPPVEDDGFETALANAVEGSVYINDRLMMNHPETYRMVSARDRPFIALSEVLDFEPDVVIDFAGLHELIDVFARQNGTPPPFYVLPPSQAHSPDLRERVAADDTLRTRVLGVNHAGPDEAHEPLRNAYLERFAQLAPTGIDGSTSVNVYEAVYFLTYAAVAGGTGVANMNRGMTRLLGLLTDARRDIGPTTIGSVVELLGSDPSLSLHGALGPPSFDPYSGGRRMPGSVWCIDENLEFATDVLRLGSDDLGRNDLVGSFPCFDL
jgi:hypothetical protein